MSSPCTPICAAFFCVSGPQAASVREDLPQAQIVGQIEQRHHVPHAGTGTALLPAPRGLGWTPSRRFNSAHGRRDSDIRTNLDLARDMTVDRIAAERGSLIESVSFLGRRWATPSELGTGSLLLGVVTGLAIGALLVWRDFPLRRSIRALVVLMTVATLTFFLLVVSMALANSYDNTGVVLAASVEVVSGPGPQYSEEFTLHSGAQVRLTDSRHGWWSVALPGGEIQGWVPAHAIEKVGRVDGG